MTRRPIPTPSPRPPPTVGGNEEQQKAKDARYLARKFKAGPKRYAGPPIPATTVCVRQQPNRNTAADTWLLVNEVAGTYTTVNTYRDVLPPSYQAATYTYPLTLAARRRIDKKIAGGLREVDGPDWPSWITGAGVAAVEVPAVSPVAKSRRKAAAIEPTAGSRPGRGRGKQQAK